MRKNPVGMKRKLMTTYVWQFLLNLALPGPHRNDWDRNRWLWAPIWHRRRNFVSSTIHAHVTVMNAGIACLEPNRSTNSTEMTNRVWFHPLWAHLAVNPSSNTQTREHFGWDRSASLRKMRVTTKINQSVIISTKDAKRKRANREKTANIRR